MMKQYICLDIGGTYLKYGIVRPAAARKGSGTVFDSTGVEKYEDLHGRI